MLILQERKSSPRRRKGRRSAGLAELRRQLAHPSELSGSARQCLREMSRRLARVHDLEDEYSRVELSEMSMSALAGNSVT